MVGIKGRSFTKNSPRFFQICVLEEHMASKKVQLYKYTGMEDGPRTYSKAVFYPNNKSRLTRS
jgi:hypothetical protein